MKPTIKEHKESKLVGIKTKMSLSNNKTASLWQSFGPRKKEISNPVNSNSYSVEIYPDTYFDKFNPTLEFEKWAAIEVSDLNSIPENMDHLIIPEGEYAVFHYKGRPSDVPTFFQYFHREWLPQSEYIIDKRPHFAVMGEKYKGENPESEEDFWIPIKKK